VRLGILLPRYGADVVGGTEHWLQMLAEHLVAERGFEVEVFTTCATSAVTWADELEPGTSELSGVTVHRHRSVSGRDPEYGALDPVIRRDPASVPDRLARRYIELVGPVCPEMIDHAEASSCDLVAVTPYLFWPAVHGVPRLGRRVVFHGAAHDEAELQLRIMRPVYAAVGGFAYNSFAERALVERRFPVAHLPGCVVGNTVVERDGDPVAARQALGIGDTPFVLCVGRVERTKGAHALAEMFSEYKRRRPGPLKLVFLGPEHERVERSPDIVIAGRQPETVKWGALREAELFITPSAFESFSLVVLESWLAGRPVLVNGLCPATMEHCRRGEGGLWFTSYATFEAALDRLLGNDELRHEMARRGEAYARATFAWAPLLDRYETLCDRVLSRLSQAPNYRP